MTYIGNSYYRACWECMFPCIKIPDTDAAYMQAIIECGADILTRYEELLKVKMTPILGGGMDAIDYSENLYDVLCSIELYSPGLALLCDELNMSIINPQDHKIVQDIRDKIDIAEKTLNAFLESQDMVFEPEYNDTSVEEEAIDDLSDNRSHIKRLYTYEEKMHYN